MTASHFTILTAALLSTTQAVVVPGAIPPQSLNLRNNQHTTYPPRSQRTPRGVPDAASTTFSPIASPKKFQTIKVSQSPSSINNPQPTGPKAFHDDHLAYHISGVRRKAKHPHEIRVLDEETKNLSSTTLQVAPTTTNLPRIAKSFDSSTTFPSTTKKVETSITSEPTIFTSIMNAVVPTSAAVPTTIKAGVKIAKSFGKSSDSDAKSKKIAAKGGFRTVIVRRHEEL
jgi:hypothetical protein